MWQFNFHEIKPEWLLLHIDLLLKFEMGVIQLMLYKRPRVKTKCLKILAQNLCSRGAGFKTSQLLESAKNSLRLLTLMVPVHHVSQERVAYSSDIATTMTRNYEASSLHQQEHFMIYSDVNCWLIVVCIDATD